jgi:hypothetical protein
MVFVRNISYFGGWLGLHHYQKHGGEGIEKLDLN